MTTQAQGSVISFRLLAVYKTIQWQHPGTSKEVNETEMEFVADGACFPSQLCIPKKHSVCTTTYTCVAGNRNLVVK